MNKHLFTFFAESDTGGDMYILPVMAAGINQAIILFLNHYVETENENRRSKDTDLLEFMLPQEMAQDNAKWMLCAEHLENGDILQWENCSCELGGLWANKSIQLSPITEEDYAWFDPLTDREDNDLITHIILEDVGEIRNLKQRQNIMASIIRHDEHFNGYCQKNKIQNKSQFLEYIACNYDLSLELLTYNVKRADLNERH